VHRLAFLVRFVSAICHLLLSLSRKKKTHTERQRNGTMGTRELKLSVSPSPRCVVVLVRSASCRFL